MIIKSHRTVKIQECKGIKTELEKKIIKEEEEVILPLSKKKKRKINSSLLIDETVNED